MLPPIARLVEHDLSRQPVSNLSRTTPTNVQARPSTATSKSAEGTSADAIETASRTGVPRQRAIENGLDGRTRDAASKQRTVSNAPGSPDTSKYDSRRHEKGVQSSLGRDEVCREGPGQSPGETPRIPLFLASGQM